MCFCQIIFNEVCCGKLSLLQQTKIIISELLIFFKQEDGRNKVKHLQKRFGWKQVIQKKRAYLIFHGYQDHFWTLEDELIQVNNFQKVFFILPFLSSSSHIQSVSIVVELWMFIYFLLFGWGKFNQNWFTHL